eukprot:352041-Chlamydomonas_euryale.AAC.3
MVWQSRPTHAFADVAHSVRNQSRLQRPVHGCLTCRRIAARLQHRWLHQGPLGGDNCAGTSAWPRHGAVAPAEEAPCRSASVGAFMPAMSKNKSKAAADAAPPSGGADDLMPSDEDLLYEEELLRNPYNLKMWLRYIAARIDAPTRRRYLLYERALRALPGSYKVWYRCRAILGLDPPDELEC